MTNFQEIQRKSLSFNGFPHHNSIVKRLIKPKAEIVYLMQNDKKDSEMKELMGWSKIFGGIDLVYFFYIC